MVEYLLGKLVPPVRLGKSRPEIDEHIERVTKRVSTTKRSNDVDSKVQGEVFERLISYWYESGNAGIAPCE
jgi:hypothetical protein